MKKVILIIMNKLLILPIDQVKCYERIILYFVS